MYINVSSNHPPQILKQLTTIISDRLSKNSSSELIFNKLKHQYGDALSKGGFKTELNKKMISSERRIIWFNLPYNQDVSTNMAKTSLKLADKHFPSTSQ